METLTTHSEVRALCRPMSSHYDDARITMFIPEAELLDVRPVIGEQLYIDLLDASGTTYSDPFATLVNGGTWTYNDRKYIMQGLKTAISYYVYARLIKDAGGQLTRFGFVQKDTQESQAAEYRQRLAAIDDAQATGNEHLNDCLNYIRLNGLDRTHTTPDISQKKYTINALGD